VPVLIRYTTAAALARLADEGARVALLLLVLQRGHGPAFGGLLVAALMVPHVVAAPLVGAAADRVRRRRLLYAGGLLTYGVALLGAALLIGLPAAAFALVVAAGCAAPLLIGGLSSLVGDLVPAGRRPRAFGLDAMSYGAAGVAGPALAAVVADTAGPIWAVLALVVACVTSAALILTLPVADRAVARERSRRDGPGAIRVLWRRPALGAVTAGSSLSQIGMGALPIVAAVLAAELHRATITGTALSALAAGNLVGALAYAKWPIRRWRPELVVLAGLAIPALPFALLPLVPGVWPTMILFAAAGLAVAPVSSSLFVVRDREAPPAVRTQVFTIGAGLKVTTAAAGAAVAGLVTGLGAGSLLLLVAASQVVAAAIGFLILRRRPDPPASPARPSCAATPAPIDR
jgi:MFS family permease